MKTEKDISQIKTKRRINSMTVAICIMIFCISLLQPLELRAALNTDGEEQNLEVQAGSEAGQIREADAAGEQETIPGQWNITDMDLVLQYDDRYSLDNIKKDWSQIKTKRRINSMTVAICIMIFCISLLQPLELRAALNTDGEEQNLEVQAGSEAGQIREADAAGEQETIPGQWNITDMDLVLQYDDRYSLDNIKKDWSVVSIETKEVYSTQVSGEYNTGERDKDIIVQDDTAEKRTVLR